MDTCKFEIQIKNYFYCCIRDGARGWAFLWRHDGVSDPCIDCPLKMEGKPQVVDFEIKSGDWGWVAGARIHAKDWKEFEERGYGVGVKGMYKLSDKSSIMIKNKE
jgi:hypothetical protein